MKAYSYICWSVLLFVSSLLCPLSYASETQQVSRNVWDLGVLAGEKNYPTTISAANISCRGRHTFEITIKGAPWLQITGPAILAGVALGETKNTAILVDLHGLAPGRYSGLVTIRCTSCPPKCTQNISELDVRVVVKGSQEEPPLAGQGMSITSLAGDSSSIGDSSNPFASISTVAQNLENYKLVGDLHNRLLDELAALQSFPDVSRDFIYSYFHGRVSAALPKEIQIPNIEQLQETWARYGSSTIKETSEKLASTGHIDARSRHYCEELEKIIASSATAKALARALDPFDRKVLDDRSLEQRGKLIVLGASSIARSSSSYWEDAIADPSSPWQARAKKEAGKGDGGGGRFWRWVVRAMADVVGFLVGGAAIDVISPQKGLSLPMRDLTVNAGAGIVVGAALSGTL